jgi:hypothetical protein
MIIMLNTSKLLEVLGNTRNYKGNPADEIKLEEQNPKQVAPDNNQFLDDLKADTEEKVEQNEVIIDTSLSKQIPEVEESK